MGKALIPPEPPEIHEVPLRDALEERYLAYALSTIMHRALPDARDGLKPVHRRILYGMRLLNLNPNSPFKKSAKIVGDVMGSFHPHGDQAIYDAMVRLAQDFSSRYPLVDGQGNFGNIDGDNPAAYRYTEARMTDVAQLLLEGIDEDGVEFRANYDGQSKEPVVLPGGFPNLLAPAAQRRRALRRRAAPDREAGRQVEGAVAMGEGTGFPDRRHHHRFQGSDNRGLYHRPRLVPYARAVEAGRGRTRHLGDRGHRNPVAGAEVAPGREDRRAA
jgi:topoisomerase-4 subunit A